MKPKKTILFIVAIFFAAFLVSCGNKTGKVKVTEEQLTDKDTLIGGEISDLGEDLFCNFMLADQWPKNAFFSDMVEAYNSFVLLNGFKSVLDKWKRYELSEEAIESLKYMDISIIKSEDLREKFAHCLELGQKFYAEHHDYSDSLLYRQLFYSIDNLDSTLSSRFHASNYAKMTDEAYWEELNYAKQSKELFDQVSTIEINHDNFHTKEVQEDVDFIKQSINQEQDFNKKCAYAMHYVYFVGFYRTDFGLIERLLDDGRYSPYLFFLWRIWRCGVQLCDGDYGPSTWSPIPNKLYNEKRLKIAETTLKHIANHRNDGVAINQYLMTASFSNIVRFGEFPMGNESFTELHYLDLGIE